MATMDATNAETSAIDSTTNNAPIPEVEWDPEELHRLMDLCLRYNHWPDRLRKMTDEFGKNRPDGFFTFDTLEHKYRRLNGETMGPKSPDDVLAWIRHFLKKNASERHSSGELAKLTRIRRSFELWQYVAQKKINDDQLEELLGVNLCRQFMDDDNFPLNQPDNKQWLEADLFRSKLSREEWISLRNPEDLITRLRNQTINKDRLLFDHPELKETDLKDNVSYRNVIHECNFQTMDNTTSPPDSKRKRPISQTSAESTPKIPKTEVANVTAGPDLIMIEPEPEVVIKRLQPVKSPESSEKSDKQEKELDVVVEKGEVSEKPRDEVLEDSVEKMDVDEEVVRQADKSETTAATKEEPVSRRLRGRPSTASADASTSQPQTPVQAPKSCKTSLQPTPQQSTPQEPEKRILRTRKPTEPKKESEKKKSDKDKSGEETGKAKKVDQLDVSHGLEQEAQQDVEEPIQYQSGTACAEVQTVMAFIRLTARKRRSSSTTLKPKKLDRRSAVHAPNKDKTTNPSTVKKERSEESTVEVKYPNVGTQTEPMNLNNVEDEVLYIGSDLSESHISEVLASLARTEPEPKEQNLKARRRTQSKRESKESHKIRVLMESDTLHLRYPFLAGLEEKSEEDLRSETSDASRSSSKRRSSRIQKPKSSDAKKPSRIPLITTAAAAHFLRPNLPLPTIPPEELSQLPIIRSAHNIIAQHKSANIFIDPVSTDVEGYHDAVKFPMDMTSIGRYIEENRLRSPSELLELYNLMVTNAIMFNENGHTVNLDARELKKLCYETIRDLRFPSQRKSTKRQSLSTGRQSARRLTVLPAPRSQTHSHAAQPHLVPGTGRTGAKLTRRTFVHVATYRTRRFKQEKPDDQSNNTAASTPMSSFV